VIIVSDTTAITSLLKINRTELLRELFGDVFIPRAVHDELLKYHSQLPSFLQVRSVENEGEVKRLRVAIDAGEAEAIILAEELRADVLLVDEK
jgi:predicted nucleic acid-binding protein